MAVALCIYRYFREKKMDRTTIMLPQDLKTRASNQAKKMKISLGQFIREAMRRSLDVENCSGWEADSLLLDNEVFNGTTPKDLSSRHDEYLHGDEM
jgi:hypothetical protein